MFDDTRTTRRRGTIKAGHGATRSGSTRQAGNRGMSEAHAACRLTTNLPDELKVTDAALELPTRLTRFGLSEVVNHLLNAEKPRRFDFVVNGELLRGTLAQSMERHEISGEQIIDIEYIELLAPPTLSSETEHPDWIAGLASARTHATLHAEAAGSFNGIVLAACYDGVSYVRTAAGEMLAELRGHSSAVKSVSWLGERRAVTASKDRTLRIWNLSGSQSQGLQAQCEKVCAGHSDSVEAVSASPAGNGFCSGGWDGSLMVWRVDPDGGEPPKKRSKADALEAPPEMAPQAQMQGHGDCISSVCWSTANLCYSGSWDGTVKEWDMTTQTATSAVTAQKAVTCLDVSLAASAIATGHSDHLLRVWDARQRGLAARLTLQHKAWVSCVAWSPHQPLHLLSACHDGSVRLWDTRSTVPLHELPPHNPKALCVAWDGDDRIVSGGADGHIHFYQIPSA